MKITLITENTDKYKMQFFVSYTNRYDIFYLKKMKLPNLLQTVITLFKSPQCINI